MGSEPIEEVWRREAPHVLAALVRHYKDVHRCEDAAQDALEAALENWASNGIPGQPRGWLIRVASRRIVDTYRQEEARRMREHLTAVRERADCEEHWAVAATDTRCSMLETLLLCCHPALSAQTQVILALHAVAGLTTAQIADSFYLSETTVGQRISRAKATIRRSGGFPAPANARERLANALRVLYLMFTQGHTISRGENLVDRCVSLEAIRLTRELRGMLPRDPEVAGLLALMILTEARRPARSDQAGDLVPLRDQDRGIWDRTAIAVGVGILQATLPMGPVGPYQIQAAIAAVHDEALTWETTDWPQIMLLYLMLDRIAPSPTVTLNLAVAQSMALGPKAALNTLDALVNNEPSINENHRFHAARAHVFEQAGQRVEAEESFARAARLCHSEPERRYLKRQRDRLATDAA